MDLLGAERAGEQKAAESTRKERTVTQSFMVLVEERLPWSSDCRTQKLQNPSVLCADTELGALLYRNSEAWDRDGGEWNFQGTDDVMVPIRKLKLAG